MASITQQDLQKLRIGATEVRHELDNVSRRINDALAHNRSLSAEDLRRLRLDTEDLCRTATDLRWQLEQFS